MIKVRKNIEKMTENEFLKEAIRELQEEQKSKGKKFKYDIEEREQKLKQVKSQ